MEAAGPAGAFGVEAVGVYLPEERSSVAEWAVANGVGGARRRALEAAGAEWFHRAGETESVVDMAAAAVADLFARCGADPASVDLLLHVHTLPFSVPAPPASLPDALRARFGMTGALAHSVSQLNCASLFGAFQLSAALAGAHPAIRRVLVVTADKVVDEFSRGMDDAIMLSDSASAVLLDRETRFNRLAAFARFTDHLYRPEPGTPLEIGRNCTLYHSRAVRALLAGAGIGPDKIDAAFGMNERPAVAEQVLRLCGIPADRLVPPNTARFGHGFGSDFAINLTHWLEGDPAGAQRALFFMNGDSGTFYALLLTHLRRFSRGAEAPIARGSTTAVSSG
jgi:3-oxoacyl-[acyl-carrier-protein] synthase-3